MTTKDSFECYQQRIGHTHVSYTYLHNNDFVSYRDNLIEWCNPVKDLTTTNYDLLHDEFKVR